MNRVIRKSKAQSAGEALDLLAALFSAELASPAKCLWLVSPWISDVELLDNTTGAYSSLMRFGRRRVRLAEVLVTLATSGTEVVVATTSDNHNRTLRDRLEVLSGDLHVESRLKVVVDSTDQLHTKALTSDDYALAGSMNITYNGIHLREEQVELRTEPDYVAQARMDAHGRFGGVL
ncbi:phospholipase D-like domain-containing protein DpdK [Actinosynnema sp. NPDC002837]